MRGEWETLYDACATWERENFTIELDFFRVLLHERAIYACVPAFALVKRCEDTSPYKVWPIPQNANRRSGHRRGRGGASYGRASGHGRGGRRGAAARGGRGRGRARGEALALPVDAIEDGAADGSHIEPDGEGLDALADEACPETEDENDDPADDPDIAVLEPVILLLDRCRPPQLTHSFPYCFTRMLNMYIESMV